MKAPWKRWVLGVRIIKGILSASSIPKVSRWFKKGRRKEGRDVIIAIRN